MTPASTRPLLTATPVLLLLVMAAVVTVVPTADAALVGSVVRFPGAGCPNQFLGSTVMADGRTNGFYIADLGPSDKRLHQVIYNPDGTIDYDAALHTTAVSSCAGMNADMVTLSTGYQLMVATGSGSFNGGVYYSPDGITWVPTTTLATLNCGAMVHLFLKAGDTVGLSCQWFTGGSPQYALAIYQSNDMFQTYTTVQAGGLLSYRFNLDDKHMLHGPGSVDMSPPAPEYNVFPEYGVTLGSEQCQYATTGASSTPTPYPSAGVCASTGISGQVGSSMQYARPAFIGTVEYLVNTVSGTAGGTFDLALFSLQTSGGTSAWVFEKRLTTGENLPTASAIHPWVVSDGSRLVVSYMDNDVTQRVFALYDGEANPTFEAAGIGTAQFVSAGSFSNGTVRFMATDPTQSVATGQLGLYTVSGFGATIPGLSLAVDNLVGGSMDRTGRNILVRVDGGAEVMSISVNTVTETGSVATPTCARFDGVITETFTYASHSEIYTSYFSCDGDNDSDTLHVRSAALGPPVFYDGEFGTPCEFQEADTVQDGDTDVPNQIGQIGVITSMTFDFHKCSDTGINYGAAAWTFTETCQVVDDCASGPGGRVGIYAVLYKTGPDQQDKADVLLDTSPFPEVTQFCSWRNVEEDSSEDSDTTVLHADYVAAVTKNGPTGVYRANADITTNAGIVDDVETSLVQRFLNNGQYGSANGISCARNTVAVLHADELQLVDGLHNGTPEPHAGWPKTVSGWDRGVALTGSAKFVAYADDINIVVAKVDGGNVTGSFPMPAGDFRSMEFDDSGEHLAVFTSDYVTVYQTEPITCATTNTCGEDSNPPDLDCLSPPCEPTTTDGPDGEGGGGAAGDFGAFGNVLAAAVVTFGAVVVGYAVTRRKEEGGGK